MTQSIVTFSILALCAVLIGLRFYRLWRSAMNPDRKISCNGGCSGCSVSDCNEKDRNI